MILSGDISEIKAPGQFVNLKLDGFFLRRPISVCDAENNNLTLIYKIVGKGTDRMSKLKAGKKLDVLTGLGNGYDITLSGNNPLLVGGGVGIPPLYMLCKRLIEKKAKPTIILGFGTAGEVFYENEFKELGVPVYVTTADGSYGQKGFVTDVMKNLNYTYFYACGPEPMFRAIDKIAQTGGQYSFEERMGCGFGACMGCSCKTLAGSKRICREGPVMKREEIIWEN
ncbi:MAG: dihydroorotate dehydrogenase electron transfer subunit [Oscillospiraceae bacterium]|nr:MAG: dihydroorotate dehydrogenase electron transfer subunit [Oscillospiraceae bacterium]